MAIFLIIFCIFDLLVLATVKQTRKQKQHYLNSKILRTQLKGMFFYVIFSGAFLIAHLAMIILSHLMADGNGFSEKYLNGNKLQIFGIFTALVSIGSRVCGFILYTKRYHEICWKEDYEENNKIKRKSSILKFLIRPFVLAWNAKGIQSILQFFSKNIYILIGLGVITALLNPYIRAFALLKLIYLVPYMFHWLNIKIYTKSRDRSLRGNTRWSTIMEEKLDAVTGNGMERYVIFLQIFIILIINGFYFIILFIKSNSLNFIFIFHNNMMVSIIIILSVLLDFMIMLGMIHKIIDFFHSTRKMRTIE